MNINLRSDYKLSDGEKYYIINILLSTYEIKREKTIFIKLANSVKSSGPESINDLIESVSIFALKKSRHNKDQVVPAVMPSIEYFFNNVQIEIRKRSCDISIFD
jgi:hypothetical protein